MPRSIWTGAISFGLVNVPVKLYSAVQRKTVRFNQLDSDGNVRIKMQRINPLTGEEVPYERLVKGFEVGPDRYVIIEPGELESLDPVRTKTIDILDFVELADIDPIFYDHPYYLAPGAGGSKPYKLLLDAMRETGKVGIAKVVIRQKEALVALRPHGNLLQMDTLIYFDEVVPQDRIDDLPGEEIETSDRELAIAKQLVETLAVDWDPEQYKDEYREKVLQLIEQKAAGEEIAVQPESPEAAPVPDLMSALKASLDAVKSDKKPAPKKKAPAKRKAPAKTG
jgi:DNA end-binding protein Ku